LIKEYNILIDNIIEKIKHLKKWNDFVEFDGIKYGLNNTVINNIHVEHDCFGEMIFINKEEYVKLHDRPFCNYDDTRITYLNYICSKCNYNNQIIENAMYGNKYKSQTGYFWK